MAAGLMPMDMQKLKLVAGSLCLLASLLVLVYQQPIGEAIGSGVMVLWMVLGALGVWLVGVGRD